MRYLKPTITAVAAISFMLTGAQGTTAVSPPERVNAALRGPAGPCQYLPAHRRGTQRD